MVEKAADEKLALSKSSRNEVSGIRPPRQAANPARHTPPERILSVSGPGAVRLGIVTNGCDSALARRPRPGRRRRSSPVTTNGTTDTERTVNAIHVTVFAAGGVVDRKVIVASEHSDPQRVTRHRYRLADA
ncbi:MAG: hypothetical protein M3314_04380 [Actinomycetota bacterium]|nr:hypothetical protein [Actinomycetota bacterium]